MSYRPSGVTILGILMLVFACLNFFYMLYVQVMLRFTSILSIFPFMFPSSYLSLVAGAIISVLLLVDGIGILSMARWGYYTALVSSILLIVAPIALFLYTIIIFDIVIILLGIAALVYLLGDVKYEYEI
ncbi:MAG: hypothetical protein KIH10_15085 [Candidatus Freyarchaeota archaeon]|nr:hypothetical protein [Candidatus Jordarchaeia archaeon]